MANVSFGQAVLTVTKFTECVHFYRELLGCEVLAGDVAGPVVHLGSAAGRFALVDRSALPADIAHSGSAAPGTGSATLAFFSADIDAVYDTLSGAGVHYTVPPRLFEQWNVRSSICHDPDGNAVEIAANPG